MEYFQIGFDEVRLRLTWIELSPNLGKTINVVECSVILVVVRTTWHEIKLS